MPINSTLTYVKQLIDQLPMPGGAPPLNAFITPPPGYDNPLGAPTAYVWPTSGEENRHPDRGGTVPRALSKPLWSQGAAVGTPNSGTKGLDHNVHVYMIWDQDNSEPQADSWFPAMVDAVMWQLRVSTDPVVVTDSYDGTVSQLVDVGETMPYQITIRFLEDQRYLRYDCLLVLPILEILQS